MCKTACNKKYNFNNLIKNKITFVIQSNMLINIYPYYYILFPIQIFNHENHNYKDIVSRKHINLKTSNSYSI